jgi:hypothetical protein
MAVAQFRISVSQLEVFVARHPTVPVVDPPHATDRSSSSFCIYSTNHSPLHELHQRRPAMPCLLPWCSGRTTLTSMTCRRQGEASKAAWEPTTSVMQQGMTKAL